VGSFATLPASTACYGNSFFYVITHETVKLHLIEQIPFLLVNDEVMDSEVSMMPSILFFLTVTELSI
jgi:hypothetical protein